MDDGIHRLTDEGIDTAYGPISTEEAISNLLAGFPGAEIVEDGSDERLKELQTSFDESEFVKVVMAQVSSPDSKANSIKFDVSKKALESIRGNEQLLGLFMEHVARPISAATDDETEGLAWCVDEFMNELPVETLKILIEGRTRGSQELDSTTALLVADTALTSGMRVVERLREYLTENGFRA